MPKKYSPHELKTGLKTGLKTVKDDIVFSPKRQAIIKAATRVFLGNGYGNASMDAIAKEAGVSKQTIYSHFGAKDTLYGAIIRDKCDQLMAPISDSKLHDDVPEKALLNIAVQFLKLVLAEENMANLRAIIAESGRFPELAEAFYAAGPNLAVKNISEYLTDMNKSGVLQVSDTLSAARMFFAMLRGDIYMRRLLRVADEPGNAEIENTARQVVEAFLLIHAQD